MARPATEKELQFYSAIGLGTTAVDPHDNEAHAIVYRYPVAEGAEPLQRESVWSFFHPSTLGPRGDPRSKEELDRLNMRLDLFLLAFRAAQQLPSDDRWSFYQIGGIHGLPHQPYDGADSRVWTKSSTWWGGYCQHGSPLFPTWHRPYVMLLEQSIIRQAKLLAEGLSEEDEECRAEKRAATEIADQIRLPYWDWADHATRSLGVPEIFTATDISLAYPWKSFCSARPIPNPLRAFVVPEDVGSPHTSSDVYNPPAKPYYVVPSEGSPFSPKGYPTARYPDSSYRSKDDKLNFTVFKDSNGELVEGVYSMLHQQEWLPFSNHSWPSEAKHGHYSSVELVHDHLHNTVGGNGGHMSYPELAGFDPVFFFHHANVDRLTALWQYCNPGSWLTPNTLQYNHDGTYTFKPDSEADETTPLTPFWIDDNRFADSDSVRDVEKDCGYTYPEIAQARRESWRPSKMLAYLLDLYKPREAFVWRWVLVVERIFKRAFNGPFLIRVFLDKPDATASTPLTSPNFAGSIFVFARANLQNAPCANCQTRQYMKGTVDLTKTMVRLGITTAAELMGGLEEDIPADNPLGRPGSIKLLFVDLAGKKELDPSSIQQWLEGGPKISLCLQQGIRDEDINEALVKDVPVDLTTSVKVLNLFPIVDK